MAFVAAPNICMVEWRYTIASQKCENRLMINVLTAPTPSHLSGLAQFAWNWWTATYAPLVSDVCNLREVVATDMSQQNGGQYVYAPNTTTVGGVAAGAFPNEVSYCISLHTAVRGRSARGRWFVAGIPLSARFDTNNVTAGFSNGTVAALQTYIDGVAAVGFLPTIVSYRQGNAPRPGGPVYFTILNSVATDTLFDSQKRRKPGVGQ